MEIRSSERKLERRKKKLKYEGYCHITFMWMSLVSLNVSATVET